LIHRNLPATPSLTALPGFPAFDRPISDLSEGDVDAFTKAFEQWVDSGERQTYAEAVADTDSYTGTPSREGESMRIRKLEALGPGSYKKGIVGRFWVATARVKEAMVITGENFSNSLEKTRIPDVCRAPIVEPWIFLVEN